MAVVADRVIVELEAKIDRYDANVRRAEQTFAKATDNISRNATRTSGLVTASFRAIGAGLTVAAALAVGRAFLNIADRAKNMEATLRLATAATGSFAVAQQDVLRIAEQTRTGLNETATLYAAFARSAKDLGLAQTQVASITQTVSQAFIVSGATAVDAAQATRQLVQAFQSGVLRGDEFNSIMENAPRLARLLADSLDIPIGSLRAMAEAGQLSADKLVTAFSDRKFTAGLQAEFDQMPVTFGQAMTLVSNSAQVTFSAFDRGGEFSKAIANFVVDGSTGFGDMATAAENMGIRVRSEFAGIAAAVGPVIDAIRGLANALDGLGSFSADGPKGLIEGTFQDIDAATKYLSQRTFGSTLFGNGTNFAGRYRSAKDKSAGERRLGLIMGADIYAGNEQYRPKQTVTAPRPGATKAGPKGRTRAGAKGPASPLDPEAFEREEAQLNIEILRDKARAADAIVRNADAAEASATLEIEALNAQQARERADTERDKRYTAEQKAKLVALQDTAYAMQRAAVIAQRDVEIAERNSRALRENENLEISALEGQKQLARSRQERLALENSILDILERQEAAELEVLIAQGRVLDATKARGDLAAQQASRRAEAARDSESPLQRYSRRLDKTPDELRDDAEQLVVEQLQEVQDGITDAIAGAIGTKNSLIKGLIGLFVEQVIMRPIADAFSQASSGGGGLGGILGSVFGSIFTNRGGSTGNGTGFGGPLGGSRASGGNVVGGQLYRVNDGGGVEGFRPAGSGTIIPLGRMRSQAGGVRLYQTVQVDARGSVNPDGYAEHIKAAVRRETVAIVGAGMRQVTQGVPARLAQFQRDGT